MLLKLLHEKLAHEVVRVTKVACLALCYGNPHDALLAEISGLAACDLRECFEGVVETGNGLEGAGMADGAASAFSGPAEFTAWAKAHGLFGYVVQMQTPVLDPSQGVPDPQLVWSSADATQAMHVRWLYSETLEQAVFKGLNWVDDCRMREVAKAGLSQHFVLDERLPILGAGTRA